MILASPVAESDYLCLMEPPCTTVVKHFHFYYHFTTIDGRDLPRFAVFRLSRDIAVENIPKNRVRKSRQIAAKYGFLGGVSRLLVYFLFATAVHYQNPETLDFQGLFGIASSNLLPIYYF